MSYVAMLLIFVSAILHAGWNLLGKGGRDILVFLWLSYIFGLLVYAPLTIYILQEAIIDPQGWYFVLGAESLSALFLVFLANSYKWGDLSLVYPITRTSPILVAIFAFVLFDEQPSTLEIFGILLVMMGVFVIPMRSLAFQNFTKPFSHLKDKGMLFAGLAAFSASFHYLIDKGGTQFFNPIVYVWLTEVVSVSLLTPLDRFL